MKEPAVNVEEAKTIFRIKTDAFKRKISLKICLICKRISRKIDKHHVSYDYNNVIEVCRKCHREIHNTNKYPMFKPIDNVNVVHMRITKKLKKWLDNKKYNYSSIFKEALKDLGYKE